jgi:hypothetical protein
MRNTRPRVPLHIEGLTVLRARYAAAVAEVIAQADIVTGRVDSPSGDPRHVFDTPDGWRLIVSRERTTDGRIGVHLSGSIHGGEATAHRAGSLDGMLDAIVRTWRFIANSQRTPVFLGMSDGGIPHFFIEQDS